jgi:serine protease AprX
VPHALTVAALDGPGLDASGIAGFSGRGAPGQDKPDVAAPGVRIVAPSAGTRDGYRTMDGTSMASPFVTGVAALLRAAVPGAGPQDVKDALRLTASGQGAWDPAWGYGALRPAAALAWLEGHAA